MTFVRKIVFLLCFTFISIGMKAEEVRVQLSKAQISIEQALMEIEKQSGVLFAVDHTRLDVNQMVTPKQISGTLLEVVNSLLEGTGCTCVRAGNQMLIIPDRRSANSAGAGGGILPFDWSEAYNDRKALQDLEQDALRGLDSVPKVQTDTLFQMVTEMIPRTYFTYPEQEIVPVPGDRHPLIRSEKKRTELALKVNLLYGGALQTPNLGFEIGVGRRSTLDLSGGYHPWGRNGSRSDNRKRVHWAVRPEYRVWLCEPFQGHFFGAYLFYWQYNVSGYQVLWVFKKEFQYEGLAVGVGISYGYHWAWSQHWGMEFHAGVGVARLTYDQYQCVRCGDKYGRYSRYYVGPTNLGIKLVWMIR